MSMKDNWKFIDDNPPWLIRLLARRRIGAGKRSVVAISDEEIAITAELPVDRIRAIYHLRSWNGVPVGELRGFCRGCKFDPLKYEDRNRAKAYGCSEPQFAYLKRSPWWNSIFLPLIERMKPKSS